MYPLILGVITTYKCPLNCEHCCFKCGPHRTEIINIEKVKRVIDLLASMTDIKCVAFTGGEPLLLGSKLNELIDYASSKNLRTRVITSAYWGHSNQSRQKIIKELSFAGLDELNISTGDFHSQYVNVDQVCETAFASALAGLNTMIAVEHHPNSDLSKGLIAQKIKTIAGNTKIDKPIHVLENIIVPLEVINSEHQENSINSHSNHYHGCKNICINLSLLPTEEVYACCGLTIQKIPDLKLGNIDELLASKNRNELETFLFGNLLHLWLAVDGPEVMANYIEKESGENILNDRMEHRCHQCLALFSHKKTRDLLYKLAPQEKSRIMLNFFQQQDFFSKDKI